MTLWGPAFEAEIEYRQAELKAAWSGKQSSTSDRRNSRVARLAERSAHPSRVEQIKRGVTGMRPAATKRRGRFA